nr:cytochrome c oxidase subunit 2 [Glomeridesmus spelaeus]QCF39623.1 cytochrome c oxidase subunit 2 [Glomeridesmus spelaeus]QCF39636.1 cytochrome c oxidase subunit 2 [Glomeridesmus spelaeus]
MATQKTIFFQDSASPLMEQLIFFHDHSLMILIMITMLISYVFLMLMNNSYINSTISQGQEIETIWTIVPAVILIFIAFPSLRLLYLMDEINNPSMTLKVMGHQWYWSYEYSDFKNIDFDSFMDNSINMKSIRLLETNNSTPIPILNQIRTLISTSDVIHAWTIPTLGIKIDAIPGRLNQVSFIINRPSTLFGQCSEICGANHSFMPIMLEAINLKSFINWISLN